MVGHAEHLGGTSRPVVESLRNWHCQTQLPMVGADDPYKKGPLSCVLSLNSRSRIRNCHSPAGRAWSGPLLKRSLDGALFLKFRAGAHYSFPS